MVRLGLQPTKLEQGRTLLNQSVCVCMCTHTHTCTQKLLHGRKCKTKIYYRPHRRVNEGMECKRENDHFLRGTDLSVELWDKEKLR